MSKERYLQEVEIDLRPTVESSYFISAQHRKKGNPNKSVWTIHPEQEVGCFIYSIENGWVEENKSWGLKINDFSVEIIGLSVKREPLQIAKYIDSNQTNLWHGYPADCKANKHDIPPMKILKDWRDKNFINKSHIRKLIQQVSCSL